jgi:drug/metabolite transporter (DMT)-like permease
MRLGEFRSNLRRNREVRRRLLTRRERVLAWALAFLPSVFVVGGIVLLSSGGGHAVGIVLLVLALLVMAVPISPFLRARVRRREAKAERER